MLSSAEKIFISEQLSIYGCTKREVQIYLELLKTGSQSIQSIAKRLRQNRITIHSATEQLIKRGIVIESRVGKRRNLSAAKPDSLQRLYKMKENEIAVAGSNIGYVIGLLNKIQTPLTNKPNVEFHQDKNGLKRMLEMTLNANGEFLAIIDIEDFAKILGHKYLEDFFARRAKKGIHSRLIFPKPKEFISKVSKKSKEYKIQVRFLPTDFDWKSGFISWNNCISLKSFSEGRITSSIIKNDDIAFFYRNLIFELLWKIGVKREKLKG